MTEAGVVNENVTPSITGSVSIEQARAAADRVLQSTVLIHAKRLRRMLRYIVDQTLDGKGNNLKEYAIGVEVFDRGENFDQRTDAIVRVEAGRLRKKLRLYYETEGKLDPVVISLPEGGYVPLFQDRSALMQMKNAPGQADRCLAVVPFDSQGAPGFPVDRLMLDIVQSVKNSGSVRVISAPAGFQVKSRQVRRICREFGVGSLLTGRIWESENRVWITAQIVDAQNGSRMWSGIYERDTDHPFSAVATEITRELSQVLRLDESAPDLTRGQANSTTEKTSLLRTVQSAFEGDLLSASAIDGADPESSATRGLLAWLTAGDLETADRELKSAALASPADQLIGSCRGAFLTATSRLEEGIAELERAHRIDPESVAGQLAIAWARFAGNQYNDAIQHFQKAVELSSASLAARWLLSWAYLATWEFGQAIAVLDGESSHANRPRCVLATLAYAYGVSGNRERAITILEELLEPSTEAHAGAVDLAAVYAGLNMDQKALDWLERGVEERGWRLATVHLSPEFYSLAKEPRFLAVLQKLRVRLEPEHVPPRPFSLTIDRSADTVERSSEQSDASTETILFVDAERVISDICGMPLKKEGYAVLNAGGPDEAMRIATEQRGAIDLIIIDSSKSLQNSSELAAELARIVPSAKILFLTGPDQSGDFAEIAGRAGWEILSMPFTPAELKRKAGEVLRAGVRKDLDPSQLLKRVQILQTELPRPEDRNLLDYLVSRYLTGSAPR